MTHDYSLIETPGALADLAERLAREACIAVDTEFVWERTFYARLGLIQIATGEGACFLIDPIALPDLAPLGALLSNRAIQKILHDAPQDLMILRRATGAVPRNIFDTRLAAGFAGLSSETSLQNLLLNLLSIQISKEHTRTDWMARPLSRAQLEYAAADVRHLPRAATLLREKARGAGIEAWLDEELELLDAPSLTDEPSPTESFRRIRSAKRLAPRSRAVLRELATWREQEARAANLPRQHVAEDAELLSLAVALPTEAPHFEKCRDLRRRTEQRYGEVLLAAVRRGLVLPESEYPTFPVEPDERKIGKERIAATVESIRKVAESKSVDPRLVHTKNDVLMLLHESADAWPQDHRLLRGWRAELLGECLSAIRESREPRLNLQY